MFDLEKFLQDREERVELQRTLQEKYSTPLLAVRSNYPGEDKLEPLAMEISDIMAGEVEDHFGPKILHREILESLEGKIHIYMIDSDVMKIKETAVYIEEKHLLGRCVDIDVYHKDGSGVSRSELGYPKRKCLVCDEIAFSCARSMAHPHSEIKKEIFNRYKRYQKFLREQEEITRGYAAKTLKAMILEVSSFPAFGLVTPLTSGSHKDMDYFTFVESSFAIEGYFQEMAKAGYSYLELDEMFRRIRRIGMAAEEKMYAATKGVNTHKGMVFLMGIAVAIASKTAYEGRGFEMIPELVSHMCRDIMKDFEGLQHKMKLTHGEKLFLEHGITGVRGVVKDGLKIVFEKSLKTFAEGIDSGAHINAVMTQTLLALMEELEDSTILHRHDFKTLKEVQEMAEKTLKLGGAYTPEGMEWCSEMERIFVERRISPGGSADLLAVTIFFYEISKKIKDN